MKLAKDFLEILEDTVWDSREIDRNYSTTMKEFVMTAERLPVQDVNVQSGIHSFAWSTSREGSMSSHEHT